MLNPAMFSNQPCPLPAVFSASVAVGALLMLMSVSMVHAKAPTHLGITSVITDSAQVERASDVATPTTVIVRAVSNDAKLLQDPVGGARIVIRHAETGDVLAEGVQRGDSGSTTKIMREPHARGAAIYDARGAAKFTTEISLTEPTPVVVTAEGPLDYPDALQRASASLMLIPGEDMSGDGLILTLHGFIVEMVTPSASADLSGEAVTVRSRVRLLCGCPTEPGGLWDASRYDIRAQLLGADGEVLSEAPMQFTGTVNEFEADVSLPDAEVQTVRVLVSDAERVNFGVGETTFAE
jgi:hypothetical protein